MSEFFTLPIGSDPSFDRTLLAVGLLPPSMARRQTLPEADELKSLFMQYWRKLEGRAWPWRLRESATRWIRSPNDANRLAAATDELLGQAEVDWNVLGRGLRLELNIHDQFDPLEVYRALLRAGAHSVFLRRKNEGEMAWSWPVRIGVATDSQLLTGVSPQSSLRPLFEAFNYERAPMRANLLLCETSLSEVTNAIKRIRHHPQTDGLIVFGGVGDSEVSVWQLLSQVSEATNAEGVFVFDHLPPDKAQTLAEALIANLSHDQPLDSAVGRLTREFGVPALSWATRSFVEATSIREQGRVMARRFQKMGNARLSLPSDAFLASPESSPARELKATDRLKLDRLVFGVGAEAISVRRVIAKDLGATIDKRLETKREAVAAEGDPSPLTFDHESAGAQKLAALAGVTAQETDLHAARSEDRHLQARVETPGGRTIRETGRMLPSRDYVACVFIGAIDPTYLNVGQALETPQPPDESPLILDVLFWEPQASATPQLKQLTLPASGNTGVAEFPFRTAENQTIFSARIAVYHRNRNLQTGLLRGRVGNEPAQLRFTLDATPLTKFVGLMDRAGIDASIIVNDDPSGNMQAFVYSDGKAAVAPVSEPAPPLTVTVDPSRPESLAGITAALGRAITRITTNPDDYSDLSSEGSRTLLLELAQHGSALLTRLRKHSQMSDLFDQVDYIQIVTGHVDAFLPIEYFYDGEAPEDQAKVCDGPQAARDALTSGQCCGAYDKDPALTICPLRFWSLTKVIERHAHLPEHTSLEGKFQLRSYPVSARNRLLDPLRSAVMGASKDADGAAKDTVKTLCQDLNAVLRTPAVPANDWTSWSTSIAATHPNLLVLLPHHEQSGGVDLLEIGGDKLKSVLIKEKHVRAPKDSNARPIVLLIGCQTSAAKLDLEGFVPAFQDAGAVIIVSTIATILGRHAGPAAATIVQELKKQEGNGNATFGDVMLAVRRRLLAAGIPMVLGLTSYGDADWRIGTT